MLGTALSSEASFTLVHVVFTCRVSCAVLSSVNAECAEIVRAISESCLNTPENDLATQARHIQHAKHVKLKLRLTVHVQVIVVMQVIQVTVVM